MKVLHFLLLLHLKVLGIASQYECPAKGEITKSNLDRAYFVAKVQVVGERLQTDKNYYLYDIRYSDFYATYHDLDYTKKYATRTLGYYAYCAAPLVNGTYYVIGCFSYETHRCRIVREFDKLTETEKERIKSMISSAYYYYLGWYAY
ncbi:hypothetical protein ANCCAN_16281 [Ancylostoma caninum]|uniref:Uncharacterized protein n=1 Tax=Ancylostoma caninum TaxID=29170 RepID=A0A368G048_ANCCA|nr:hypothetical protein ANCCAN_16281 [Ancylostoma caninum]